MEDCWAGKIILTAQTLAQIRAVVQYFLYKDDRWWLRSCCSIHSCRAIMERRKYRIKVPTGIKSRHSRVKSFLNFKNLTNGIVTLYWVDFDGNAKTFAKLNPMNRCDIGFLVETYRSHPWIATRNGRVQVLLNGKRYFFPPSMNEWSKTVNGHLNNKWNLSSQRDHTEASTNSEQNYKEVLITNAGCMSLEQLSLLRCCEIYQTDEKIGELEISKYLKSKMNATKTKYFLT
ncbi:uncharacterized protein LOC130658043 [Hydractinia symbiolongicarpus]|uniref:uncharacterized protein LOC130658043 n=1 Tax=Hydractinia symbiolongicarpus TaxID=13093 RepID=UPI00254C37A4|nr:uncharacterized protein LOC130658043 [Hydractinia symbiolongicarpus]